MVELKKNVPGVSKNADLSRASRWQETHALKVVREKWSPSLLLIRFFENLSSNWGWECALYAHLIEYSLSLIVLKWEEKAQDYWDDPFVTLNLSASEVHFSEKGILSLKSLKQLLFEEQKSWIIVLPYESCNMGLMACKFAFRYKHLGLNTKIKYFTYSLDLWEGVK